MPPQTPLTSIPIPPEALQMGDNERFWDIPLSPTLTNVQLRAIELTIQGFTDVQIAQSLSINRRTLWHWKTQNEDYRQTLSEARHQYHASVTDRCLSIVYRATAILINLLDDPTAANQMRAAQILLNIATRCKPAPLQPQPPLPPADCPEPELNPKVG